MLQSDRSDGKLASFCGILQVSTWISNESCQQMHSLVIKISLIKNRMWFVHNTLASEKDNR